MRALTHIWGQQIAVRILEKESLKTIFSQA